MIIQGKFNTAIVYTERIEDSAIRQIQAIGKGNEEWNCSAPHGAGRLLSRGKARATLTMEEFEEQMKGIYTTSVNQSTLDESPMAYKSLADIVDNITPTVDILKRIVPIYNFKSSEEVD